MSESSIRQIHMVAAFVIKCEESPSGINISRDARWEHCPHKKCVSFPWLWANICLCAYSKYASVERTGFTIEPADILGQTCRSPAVFHELASHLTLNHTRVFVW